MTEALPVDTCGYRNLAIADEWAVAVSIPCHTWIFCARVRAAYRNSRSTNHFFLIFWAITLMSLGVPFSVKLTSVSLGNHSCYNTIVFNRHVVIICLILLSLFDMAVFVAISIRVMSPNNPSSSWRSKLSSLVFGDDMGHISRLFLKSSQIYYL